MNRSFPWRELRHALWFPIYLVTYAALERLFPTAIYFSDSPFDRLIPFCELFVIPYSLWYPLLIGLGLYLMARDKAAYHRYMDFLAATFFLSALIWFLYPNGQTLRPEVMPRDNLLTGLISFLYSIDTSTNVFPSVHVVGSLGALLAVWDCPRLRIRHQRWCLGITVLSVLICLSTVFIKQHAALDVAGGLLLSLLVAVPIYYRSPAYRLRPKWA